MTAKRSQQPPPPPLFELEGEIMDEVWRCGSEITVREVMDALNRRAKERKYTTIMTTMMRLQNKGLLTRQREGKTDIYTAALSHDEYLEARAQSEVGALVNQYGDLALMHFAKQISSLDPKRAAALRKLARGG